jgi:peptide/nickel transport system substrate-binding protein
VNHVFDQNFKNLTFIKKIQYIFENLSITERTVAIILITIMLISGYFALDHYLNTNFKTEIPVAGGDFTHGTINSPRFINPLLANSETDKSLTNLIYSGLMRNENGEMILDLASQLEISDDGLEYTFHIDKNAKFHDGKPVTSEDVIFTINKAKDPELKGNKRSNWEGINVEKIDEKTLKIILNQPFEPFIQNTSLGILPKHIWQDITATEFAFSIYNSNPVGSGPYKIKKITRDQLGIPKTYILESNKDFISGKPLINEITFKFAKNEDELFDWYKNNKIDSYFGISPDKANQLEKAGFEINDLILPRIFGVFFNQNKPSVLATNNVRNALNIAIDKQKIIQEILFGYGEEISNPIPKNFNEEELEILTGQNIDQEQRIKEAQKILEKAGWEKGEDNIYVIKDKEEKKMLTFSIATTNVPELIETANKIAEVWNKIGAQIEVKVYEQNDFSQNIIRPRNYDAILFGIAVNKISDLYAFWHSSQRNDPGLNIAGYANIAVDASLDKIKKIFDIKNAQEEIKKIETEIQKDIPVITIYSPQLLYAINSKIKINNMTNINTPDEIFNHAHKWHIKTEKILKILKNEDS